MGQTQQPFWKDSLQKSKIILLIRFLSFLISCKKQCFCPLYNKTEKVQSKTARQICDSEYLSAMTKAWPRSPKSRSRSRSRSLSEIEIAIAIPIPIWKTICDPIAIAALQSHDLLGDIFTYKLMELLVIIWKKVVMYEIILLFLMKQALPLPFLILKAWKTLQTHCFEINSFNSCLK